MRVVVDYEGNRLGQRRRWGCWIVRKYKSRKLKERLGWGIPLRLSVLLISFAIKNNNEWSYCKGGEGGTWRFFQTMIQDCSNVILIIFNISYISNTEFFVIHLCCFCSVAACCLLLLLLLLSCWSLPCGISGDLLNQLDGLDDLVLFHFKETTLSKDFVKILLRLPKIWTWIFPHQPFLPTHTSQAIGRSEGSGKVLD